MPTIYKTTTTTLTQTQIDQYPEYNDANLGQFNFNPNVHNPNKPIKTKQTKVTQYDDNFKNIKNFANTLKKAQKNKLTVQHINVPPKHTIHVDLIQPQQQQQQEQQQPKPKVKVLKQKTMADMFNELWGGK